MQPRPRFSLKHEAFQEVKTKKALAPWWCFSRSCGNSCFKGGKEWHQCVVVGSGCFCFLRCVFGYISRDLHPLLLRRYAWWNTQSPYKCEPKTDGDKFQSASKTLKGRHVYEIQPWPCLQLLQNMFETCYFFWGKLKSKMQKIRRPCLALAEAGRRLGPPQVWNFAFGNRPKQHRSRRAMPPQCPATPRTAIIWDGASGLKTLAAPQPAQSSSSNGATVASQAQDSSYMDSESDGWHLGLENPRRASTGPVFV